MKSKFDPQKHHRRSIRLQSYDYSWTGAYYVTIVTWRRDMLFGEILNGEMILNKAGKIVLAELLELPKRLHSTSCISALAAVPGGEDAALSEVKK